MSLLLDILILLGAAFTLVAALGMLRFPDFYCRMHAATKAGAFGGSLLLLATAVALPSPKVLFLCLLTLVFFYFTTPVAGHLLARAALARKVYRADRKDAGGTNDRETR